MDNQLDEQKNEKPEDMEESGNDIVSEEEAQNPQELIKKIRHELKECRGQKQEYLEGWQRTKADFINARKNLEEEKEKLIKYASENLLLNIIPVLDSFEMAFKEKFWQSAESNWKSGIENIYEQLRSVMLQNGVAEIKPKSGSVFNPQEQEAVSEEQVSDKNLDNTVVELVQKGYTLNGRIVRVAKVRVAGYKE